MKKILFLIALSFLSYRGIAQMPVIDAASGTQLIALGSAATEQIATLSKMFDVLEKTAKIRNAISQGIVVIGGVKNIIVTCNAAINSTNYLIDHITRNHKILNARDALRYSGVCINTVESIIRSVNKVSQLIEDNFIEGDPLAKAEALSKIEKDMEDRQKEIAKMESQVKYEIKMKNMERSFLQSQGILR